MSWSKNFHRVARIKLRDRKINPLDNWRKILLVAAEKGEMSYRYECEIDELGQKAIQELKDEGFEVKISHPVDNVTWVYVSWENATEDEKEKTHYDYVNEYHQWQQDNDR